MAGWNPQERCIRFEGPNYVRAEHQAGQILLGRRTSIMFCNNYDPARRTTGMFWKNSDPARRTKVMFLENVDRDRIRFDDVPRWMVETVAQSTDQCSTRIGGNGLTAIDSTLTSPHGLVEMDEGKSLEQTFDVCELGGRFPSNFGLFEIKHLVTVLVTLYSLDLLRNESVDFQNNTDLNRLTVHLIY